MKKAVPDDRKKGMRMKELSNATGLPKSTILHYIAQGLLPEPDRTGRNTAFYDPACVERAKYIKSIQAAYSFPLDKIKKLLLSRDRGEDVTTLEDLHATVFGAADGATLDEEAFRRATGLSHGQIADLLRTDLLLPLEKGSYRQEDVEAGVVYAGALSLGIKIADLAFYAAIAKELVDHEMRLRQHLTGHLPDAEDAGITAQLTRGARILRNYVANRVFQRRVAGMKTLKEEEVLS